MPNFSPIITDAYQGLLERKPDPGGLANYNRLMNQSMTEADMRESLLRSPEYASKNPDPGIATRPRAQRPHPALQKVIKSDHARFLLQRGRVHSKRSV